MDGAQPQGKNGFYLRLTAGSESTTRWVEGETFKVGRAPDCHLSLSHETLSRLHLTISLKGGKIRVEDHGSSNGSFINGKRILPHSPVGLNPNDRITMGRAPFTLNVFLEPFQPKSVPPQPPKDEVYIPETHAAVPVEGEASSPFSSSAIPDIPVHNDMTAASMQPTSASTHSGHVPSSGNLVSSGPSLVSSGAGSQVFHAGPSTASDHVQSYGAGAAAHVASAQAGVSPTAAPAKDERMLQAETILREAQNKAALIIQEAGIAAEQKVEEVHRRAYELQSKTEEAYHRRINEAYRNSEDIYKKAHSEAQVLIEGARTKAAEVRGSADAFVLDLRRRTEEECEKLLAEAQDTGRALKENRLLEAEEIIKKREEELLTKALEDHKGRMEQEAAAIAKDRAKVNEEKKFADKEMAELKTRVNHEVEEQRLRMTKELEDRQTRVTKDLEERKARIEQEITERKRKVEQEVTERKAKVEEELNKEVQSTKAALKKEVDERKGKLDAEYKEKMDAIAKAKATLKDITDKTETQQGLLNVIEGNIQKEMERSKRLEHDLQSQGRSMSDLHQRLSTAKAEMSAIEANRAKVEARIKEGQEILVRLTEQIRDAEERLKDNDSQQDQHLAQLRNRLEENKSKLEREESKHAEELRLQTMRKVRAMEIQMMEELHMKKQNIGRELTLLIETYLKKDPESRKGIKTLHEQIDKALQTGISSISKDDGAKNKQASLVSLKRRQKVVSTFTGVMLGALGLFAGQHLQEYLNQDQSLLQRKVAAVQEERKRELEARKFNPPMTPEYKATYVDNVVYTTNFVSLYTSDDFQIKLRKGLTLYMLKTWKLEEEKVIELLGITRALVRGLSDKRDSINPDFIPQGLERMKEVESEASARLLKLLGSKVRIESFQDFEKKFYENYLVTSTASPAAQPSSK